jgi:hypothetical protein
MRQVEDITEECLKDLKASAPGPGVISGARPFSSGWRLFSFASTQIK